MRITLAVAAAFTLAAGAAGACPWGAAKEASMSLPAPQAAYEAPLPAAETAAASEILILEAESYEETALQTPAEDELLIVLD